MQNNTRGQTMRSRSQRAWHRAAKSSRLPLGLGVRISDAVCTLGSKVDHLTRPNLDGLLKSKCDCRLADFTAKNNSVAQASIKDRASMGASVALTASVSTQRVTTRDTEFDNQVPDTESD